jgi:hypothetical protein
MFKFFYFSPLKQKSAGKFTGKQRIFLQIFRRILALWNKIKNICTYTKKDTETKTKNL